jgi:hypothetical protein
VSELRDVKLRASPPAELISTEAEFVWLANSSATHEDANTKARKELLVKGVAADAISAVAFAMRLRASLKTFLTPRVLTKCCQQPAFAKFHRRCPLAHTQQCAVADESQEPMRRAGYRVRPQKPEIVENINFPHPRHHIKSEVKQ